MIARVSTYANVDLDMADRLKAWMDGDGAGTFDGLPGYRGSLTLVDRDNARVVGIGFYDSAGDAREAEAQLAEIFARGQEELPEDLRDSVHMRPESEGLYEVAHRDQR
jgi:hypothetical protein